MECRDRGEVYNLIDQEREYQGVARPGTGQGKPDNELSVADWICFIRHHLAKADNQVYYLDPSAAMAEIRKVAALAVAAMEHNDTPQRPQQTNPQN